MVQYCLRYFHNNVYKQAQKHHKNNHQQRAEELVGVNMSSVLGLLVTLLKACHLISFFDQEEKVQKSYQDILHFSFYVSESKMSNTFCSL